MYFFLEFFESISSSTSLILIIFTILDLDLKGIVSEALVEGFEQQKKKARLESLRNEHLSKFSDAPFKEWKESRRITGPMTLASTFQIDEQELSEWKAFWRPGEEAMTNDFFENLKSSIEVPDEMRLHDVHTNILFDQTSQLPQYRLHLTGKLDGIFSCCEVGHSDNHTLVANAVMGVELKTNVLESVNTYMKQAVGQLVLGAHASAYSFENVLTDGYFWHFFSLAKVSNGIRVNRVLKVGFTTGSSFLLERLKDVYSKGQNFTNIFDNLDDDEDEEDDNDFLIEPDNSSGNKFAPNHSLNFTSQAIAFNNSGSSTTDVSQTNNRVSSKGSLSDEEYRHARRMANFWELVNNSPIFSGV